MTSDAAKSGPDSSDTPDRDEFGTSEAPDARVVTPKAGARGAGQPLDPAERGRSAQRLRAELAELEGATGGSNAPPAEGPVGRSPADIARDVRAFFRLPAYALELVLSRRSGDQPSRARAEEWADGATDAVAPRLPVVTHRPLLWVGMACDAVGVFVRGRFERPRAAPAEQTVQGEVLRVTQ